MIKIDNNEYRNLEEQVQENQRLIAKHYQATQLPLNLAGIFVLGEVGGDPSDYGLSGTSYGQAYVQIKDEKNTILWIWTRANPAAGEPNDYWLDIPYTTEGPIGDKGDKGDRGERGIRGSRWYSMPTAPISNPDPTEYQEYDIWYNYNTGNIWHLHVQNDNLVWLPEGTIKGKQGPPGPPPVVGPNGNWFVNGVDTGNPSKGEQGERGPTGDRGPSGSILIPKGIVTSIDQLPTYSEVPENSAYYYSTTGEPPFEVYGIVGTGWAKVGDVTTGTVVLVNNTVQDEWNADTKLDKVTSTGGRRVYAISGSGQQDVYTLRPDITSNPNYQIVVRDASGQINVPASPVVSSNATSKQYVDSKAVLYEHNINITGTALGGDSYEAFEKHYNHSSTPETFLDTGTTAALSGIATISGEVCPIVWGEINTNNSAVSISYIRFGGVETSVFDDGDNVVTDTVRTII